MNFFYKIIKNHSDSKEKYKKLKRKYAQLLQVMKPQKT